MKASSIHLWFLLKISLKMTQPFYRVLLILSIPFSIPQLFDFIVPKTLLFVFYILFYLLIGSILGSAAFHYIYFKITGEKVSIRQSVQVSISKFMTLLIWKTLQVVIFAHLVPRLIFVTRIIVIEDRPLEDAVRRSWNLTKGYGWQLFGSMMAWDYLGFRGVDFLSNSVTTLLYGGSFSTVFQILPATESPGIVARLITLGLLLFVLLPVQLVFYTLFFLYLLNAEGKNPRLDSIITPLTQNFE